MLDFHRKLAQLGLEATADWGFVLAGGYAITANGISNRPSTDVDLFTNRADPAAFAVAVERLRTAFENAGMQVEARRVGPTFYDAAVIDPATGESSALQLGLDYRRWPPMHVLDLGPVLDVRDAVANKMTTLASRGEARDYVDIDAVITSGRFDRRQLLEMADQAEATPLDRAMLAQRFRESDRHDEDTFAMLGVDSEHRVHLIERFHAWADVLEEAATPPGRQRLARAADRIAAAEHRPDATPPGEPPTKGLSR